MLKENLICNEEIVMKDTQDGVNLQKSASYIDNNSHPLYLHNNDHPGLVLIAKKLAGPDNFGPWS